jgi:hypothetical protein
VIAKLLPLATTTPPIRETEAAKLQEVVVAGLVTVTQNDDLAGRALALGLVFIDVSVTAWTLELLNRVVRVSSAVGYKDDLARTRVASSKAREDFDRALDRFALAPEDARLSASVRGVARSLQAWLAAGFPLSHWEEAMRRIVAGLTSPERAESVPPTPEETALLEEIMQFPDDDARKRRWAKLAGARHDPRAVLAEVQLENRAERRKYPDRWVQDGNTVRIPIRENPEWTHDVRRLGATEAGLSSGFVSSITIATDAFLENAAALFRVAPIRRVRLLDVAPHFDAAIMSVWLSQLLWLDLSNELLDDTHIVRLANAPKLAGLRALSLDGNRISDVSVRAIWTSPSLASLEYCGLDGNPCSPIVERELSHQEMSSYEWVRTNLACELEASFGRRRWAFPPEGEWPPHLDALSP